jgi:hypothetical protein
LSRVKDNNAVIDELIVSEHDIENNHRLFCAVNIATIHQGLRILNYYLPSKDPDFRLFDPFSGSLIYYLDQLLGKHKRKPVSLTSLSIGQSHRVSSVPEFDEIGTFRKSETFRQKFGIADKTNDSVLAPQIKSVYKMTRKYLEKPTKKYPQVYFLILEEVFADLRKSYPL